MKIAKLLIAAAIGGIAYALCNEKTQKNVKDTVRGLGRSIHDLGDEAAEKVSVKVSKEKAQHA